MSVLVTAYRSKHEESRQPAHGTDESALNAPNIEAILSQPCVHERHATLVCCVEPGDSLVEALAVPQVVREL